MRLLLKMMLLLSVGCLLIICVIGFTQAEMRKSQIPKSPEMSIPIAWQNWSMKKLVDNEHQSIDVDCQSTGKNFDAVASFPELDGIKAQLFLITRRDGKTIKRRTSIMEIDQTNLVENNRWVAETALRIPEIGAGEHKMTLKISRFGEQKIVKRERNFSPEDLQFTRAKQTITKIDFYHNILQTLPW